MFSIPLTEVEIGSMGFPDLIPDEELESNPTHRCYFIGCVDGVRRWCRVSDEARELWLKERWDVWISQPLIKVWQENGCWRTRMANEDEYRLAREKGPLDGFRRVPHFMGAIRY